MNFPILYKKTSTGAIQQWEILSGKSEDGRGFIMTVYGQVGSEKLQRTSDWVSEGKNVGKKNATTPAEQAEAEAKAKWEKQKKKGYVETKDGAENDELDDLIEGGEEPMLAEAYMDIIYDQRPGHEQDPPQYIRTSDAKKIKWPCAEQCKLDGIRCIAIIVGGECTLWSRTRKPINSVPHIIQELEAAFEHRDVVLDGELYNHEMKAEFEKIVSLVRQKKPAPGHEVIQYHVYDMISDESFKNRSEALKRIFDNFEFYSLKQVKTNIVKDEAAAIKNFEKNVKAGYEGAMLRNLDSDYRNKRSVDLQKIKPFIDDEFPITGVTEGRGKMAGLAIFTCKAKNGNPFEVKLKGELESLRKYIQDEKTWKGKELTVRYQGLTNKERVPRFPVGIAVRDYE